VLSPAEVQQRLAAIAHLKVHPRDRAENQAVLSRAERLFAERLGEERAQVAGRLDQFRTLLERQDPAEIGKFRTELIEWLDLVDTSYFQ